VYAANRYWRFRFALCVWARIVPVLAWRTDLVTLLERVAPAEHTPYQGLPAHLIAYRVKRAVRRPYFMTDRRCLREGVLADRFLRLAGYYPELRFGIDRASVATENLSAHCWIVLDNNMIMNAPPAEMVEVLVKNTEGKIGLPVKYSPAR
jgi:hypothetical protein